ncbi:MAG TPA: hypothetical protein VGD07_22795 [Methylomirabilota bacterium]
MIHRAWALSALLLLAAPGAAHAQLFLASRPDPPFAVGPLFVTASVTPAMGPVVVDVLFSIDVPPTRSAADAEQDLFLVWPSGVVADLAAGPADPGLERYLTERGFTVVDSGRLELSARNLYAGEDGERAPAEPVPGGAPFATFVREGGALGLSAPATWVRLPWNPRFVNRVYMMRLRMTTRGLVKDKPATWVERTFWGPRHRLSLSFNEIRHRAVFPIYFQHRDRVLRLGDEPAQLILNFADADRLKIDEMSPQSARRQLSETLESTDTVSLFLDRSDGITPQVLTVQFGYFTGLQSWAPVLIPTLFFVLGNVAAVLVRTMAERLSKRLAGRVLFARAAAAPPPRQQGVVLERGVLDKVVPGVTTHDEVLKLCGHDVEEQSRLAAPERRTLIYRGRRVLPHRQRAFGWLATVDHWDVEQHEVEIELDGNVVRDVQARVRRSRLNAPQ